MSKKIEQRALLIFFIFGILLFLVIAFLGGYQIKWMIVSITTIVPLYFVHTKGDFDFIGRVFYSFVIGMVFAFVTLGVITVLSGISSTMTQVFNYQYTNLIK